MAALDSAEVLASVRPRCQAACTPPTSAPSGTRPDPVRAAARGKVRTDLAKHEPGRAPSSSAASRAKGEERLRERALGWSTTRCLCFELACLLLFPFVLVPLAQGFGAFVFEVR
jgi:hypothetical protein